MMTSIPTAVLGKATLVILTALLINWIYEHQLGHILPGQAAQRAVYITESEDERQETNERPVIGVLAQGSINWRSSLGDTLIFAAHIRWLQMAGANVIPIWIDKPPEYYERLIKQLNGIYIPGGSSHPIESRYGLAANRLVKMAIRMNDEGVHFPIWGTCLGFQFFLCAIAGEDVRYTCNQTNKKSLFYRGKDYFHHEVNTKSDIVKQTFTESTTPSSDFRGSFIDKLPVEQRNVLLNDDILPHFHRYCISREEFYSHKSLVDFFREVSVNTDENGTEYLSTLQAKSYPFYATQWHPEKYSFHWTELNPIPHATKAIKVGQAISNFFVSQARRNNQKFDSKCEEEASYIENFQILFMGYPTFASFYFFKNETMTQEALNRRMQELDQRRNSYNIANKKK